VINPALFGCGRLFLSSGFLTPNALFEGLVFLALSSVFLEDLFELIELDVWFVLGFVCTSLVGKPELISLYIISVVVAHAGGYLRKPFEDFGLVEFVAV